MSRPSSELVQLLQVFEKDLDTRLADNCIHSQDADQTLELLMHLSEHVATCNPGINSWDKAIEVYAAHLVSGASGETPSAEGISDDLLFAAHYYELRDYLYYAFNFEGAFQWTMDDAQVDIRFLDRSIPRQFALSHNETILSSLEHIHDASSRHELQALIRGIGECGQINGRIDKLLKAEAEHKLAAYFSIIPHDSQIDLGGYTYAQFYAVYRMLVSMALWHRYQTTVYDRRGALSMSENELVAAAATDTGIAEDNLRRILCDLIYDAAAARDRLSPGYFSLMREGRSGRIWMRPTHFCTHEGIVGLLRVVAQRRSKLFLSNVSGPLGARFVDRLATAFSAQGFQCLREVKLAQYDSRLPDIDLLVISHEPTLGYVILVCELKCPLPSAWAKDHLRALNSDGISKAFIQSQRIGDFLTSEGGLEVLRNWLPNAGLPPFDHFVVILEPIVITSHNGGMFFDAMHTPVFAYRTIERMLQACDGDMSYIQHMLHIHNDFIDHNVTTTRRSISLKQRHVSYDVLDDQPIVRFPLNHWRSDVSRDSLVQEFLSSGLRPLDAFQMALQGLPVELSGETTGEIGQLPRDGQRTVILFDQNPERRGIYQAIRESIGAAPPADADS